MRTMPRSYRRVAALISILGACEGGASLKPSDTADYDGDGTPNAVDCGPYDRDLRGDGDDDGWWDVRCLERASSGVEGYFLPPGVDEALFRDCDDADAAVHPPDEDDTTEHPLDLVSVEGSVCPSGGVPASATDGKDNDCDGVIDVPDWDRDGVIASGHFDGIDCDDCRDQVHPGMDERQTVSNGAGLDCPELMYDGIDNDCDPATSDEDFDGDGQPGGWPSGSACSAVTNRTTGLRLQDLPSAVEGEDCFDLDPSIYEGAPEFCDLIDQNCSGSYSVSDYDPRAATEEHGLDGFESDGDGLRILYVNSSTSADPTQQTGADREHALPTVGAALSSVSLCPVVSILPGTYQERLLLDLGDLGGVGSDGSTADTGSNVDSGEGVEDTAGPEGGAAGRALRLQAPDGPATLDGLGGSFLTLVAGDGDEVVLSDLRFLGGGDGLGGFGQLGGSLQTIDVHLQDVHSESAPALLHQSGITSAHSGLVVDGCASGLSSPVDLSALTIELEGLTATNNESDAAGGALGIHSFAQATIRSSAFGGNTSALDGGAFAASGDALILDGLTVTENLAGQNGGGASIVTRSLDIGGLGSWLGNQAANNGGGLYIVAASGVMSGQTLQENVAGVSGGGAHWVGDQLTADGLIFSLNQAGADGGGALLLPVQATLTNIQSTANRAVGGHGGGAYVVGSAFTLSGWTGTGDQAATGGGSVYLVGVGARGTAIELSDSSFSDSTTTTGPGGAAFLSASANGSIQETTVSCAALSGFAAEQGGGLAAVGLDLALIGINVTGCAAEQEGGGLFVSATNTALLSAVEIDQCTSGAEGGGAFASADAELTMSSAQIHDCVAASDGGGLYAAAVNNAALDHLTLTDNEARSGGGLYLLTNTSYLSELLLERNTASQSGGGAFVTTLHHTEVSGGLVAADNTAAYGGGVALTGGQVEIYGPTFTDNTASANGGGLYLYGLTDFEMWPATFTGTAGVPSALLGGAISVEASASVSFGDLVASNLEAVQTGGAIYASSVGSLGLSGDFSACKAGSSAAWLAATNVGSLTVENSTISDVEAPIAPLASMSAANTNFSGVEMTDSRMTGSTVALDTIYGHISFTESSASFDDVVFTDGYSEKEPVTAAVYADEQSDLSIVTMLLADHMGEGIVDLATLDADFLTVADCTDRGVRAADASIRYSAIVNNGADALLGFDEASVTCSYSAGNGDDNLELGFCTGNASFNSDWEVSWGSLPSDCNDCLWTPRFRATTVIRCAYPGYTGGPHVTCPP